MQTPEELVDKIRREENDLSAKLLRLEYFMMTEDFIKVSPEQKTLLEQQHKVMTEYKLILIKRAHRINWEAGRDKAAVEIKKATEEQEGKERIPDEVCRGCKYYNVKADICTNRSNKDGKCWEPEEEHTGLEDRPCEECKWDGTPGCEMCVRHDRWNPKETTERLEPHVFAAMEYEAWKKKQEEETAEQKPGNCSKYSIYPVCPYIHDESIPKCIHLKGDKCSYDKSACYRHRLIQNARRRNGTQSNQ